MFSLLFVLSCQNSPNLIALPPSENTLQRVLQQHDLPRAKPIPNGLQTPVQTEFGVWQLSIQYFADQKVLYIAINDYLWLDSSATAQSSVFAFTQMLTQNHAMVGGKFQLNPTSGAITLGTELTGVQTILEPNLHQAIDTLIDLGKDNYPMLQTALGAHFY